MCIFDFTRSVRYCFVAFFDTAAFNSNCTFLEFPWRAFYSELWQWQFQTTEKSSRVWKSRPRRGRLRWKYLSYWQVRTWRSASSDLSKPSWFWERPRMTIGMRRMTAGVWQLFFRLFLEKTFPVTLFNDKWVLQIVLENSPEKPHTPYEMSLPTALEKQLYFHAVDLTSRDARRIKVKMVQNTSIVRWQAWRFIMCGRLGIRSWIFVCLSDCGLW